VVDDGTAVVGGSDVAVPAVGTVVVGAAIVVNGDAPPAVPLEVVAAPEERLTTLFELHDASTNPVVAIMRTAAATMATLAVSDRPFITALPWTRRSHRRS
jgi:hypothetical protein